MISQEWIDNPTIRYKESEDKGIEFDVYITPEGKEMTQEEYDKLK